MPEKNLFSRIGGQISTFCAIIITIAISIMTVSMFVQVVARFVFQQGLWWAEELSRYMQVTMVFLGAAIATYEGGHIAVTVLEEVIPKKYFRTVKYVQLAFEVVYSALVLWIGWKALGFVGMQKSPNMGLAMKIPYALIPIAMAIMLVQMIMKLNRVGK